MRRASSPTATGCRSIAKSRRGKPDLYIAPSACLPTAIAFYNLEYAAKDASDFVRLISGKSRDSFREVHQLLLTDDQVTAGAVERLKAFFSQGAAR